ncbi:MAG: hypothetical protein Q4A19_04305 [Johnsonella sp.]|nr:hypothetical protein [Johnsonella sp.]
MAEDYYKEEELRLCCARCNRFLEIKSVTLSYMGSAFPVKLPACPGCGMVYISEALASGRMLHVEKSLEDK